MLAHLERLGDLGHLEHGAEAHPRFRPPRIAAEDARRTGVRRQEPEEQLDGGRLAGAVGAEEREDLAARDGQLDVGERHDVAVALDDAGEDGRRSGERGGRGGAGRSAPGGRGQGRHVDPPFSAPARRLRPGRGGSGGRTRRKGRSGRSGWNGRNGRKRPPSAVRRGVLAGQGSMDGARHGGYPAAPPSTPPATPVRTSA